MQVQTGSIEEQTRLSERPLGNDAINLEVTEECPREGLVNSPPVGQTSFVMVRGEDDLEAVRDELIKVQSYPSIFTHCTLIHHNLNCLYWESMLHASWCSRDSLKLIPAEGKSG
jgi:hypothetical protein